MKRELQTAGMCLKADRLNVRMEQHWSIGTQGHLFRGHSPVRRPGSTLQTP